MAPFSCGGRALGNGLPNRWAWRAAKIFGVLYAPDGALWYGCDSDLCRLSNGKTTHMNERLNLPDEQWASLLLARDGHIWLRGNKHVVELLPAEGRFELARPSRSFIL